MSKFIALRSEFCTLDLVIFENGQNPYGPQKWPKPVCRIVLRRGEPKQDPTLGGVSTEGMWP